ncbi:hypothetical protein PR048_027166 [Dryococelus australis]|uniref:Myotubularin phosphatase domain-containing protein n=1 Tax=Dryococelus australis TaxID=614101 RepID=A0ABQ9GEN6_9NEOP|nr:hypothetical protein PR048_027166 [Dryococelus australis]
MGQRSTVVSHHHRQEIWSVWTARNPEIEEVDQHVDVTSQTSGTTGLGVGQLMFRSFLTKPTSDRFLGARRGYSYKTQLAGLLEDLVQRVDEGKKVDACFIDFEKAFDKVPHGTLMKKVEELIPDKRVEKAGQDGEDERNYRASVMMKEMGWSSLKDRRKVERLLLHRNIDLVERKPNGLSGGSVILKCKDFRIIQLDIGSTDDFVKVATSMEGLSSIGESALFALLPSKEAQCEVISDGASCTGKRDWERNEKKSAMNFIRAFAWSDFGKPWKTEIRMAESRIETGSSRMRLQSLHNTFPIANPSDTMTTTALLVVVNAPHCASGKWLPKFLLDAKLRRQRKRQLLPSPCKGATLSQLHSAAKFRRNVLKLSNNWRGLTSQSPAQLPVDQDPGPITVAAAGKNSPTLVMLMGHQEEHFSQLLTDVYDADDVTRMYPFFYRPMYPILEDGWTAFRPETEYAHLINSQGEEWRISYINRDFSELLPTFEAEKCGSDKDNTAACINCAIAAKRKVLNWHAVCPTYPSAVVVPKSVDDETIIAAANFREGGRFPVLSYRHEGGSVLMRSSQPMTGPNSRRCREDERLINSVLGPGKRGYIIDTRTQTLAQTAKVLAIFVVENCPFCQLGLQSRGGGYELEMYYPQWRRVNKPIDRHSVLLDCLTKLIEGESIH